MPGDNIRYGAGGGGPIWPNFDHVLLKRGVTSLKIDWSNGMEMAEYIDTAKVDHNKIGYYFLLLHFFAQFILKILIICREYSDITIDMVNQNKKKREEIKVN